MKIPYLVVRERHGKRLAYWCPTPKMKAAGFALIALGLDGPDAWRDAETWNERWQAHRRGAKEGEKPKWPRGSLGEAYERYRATEGWSRKQPRTREDWERGWRYISPIFGDIAPHTVDYDLIDTWYANTIEDAGVREAHRAMKIWRALWVVAAAMSGGRHFYCSRGADPSLGVRRVTPTARQAVWQEHELRRIIHRAWREGYRGLACLVSIMWDTAFSPVDARSLTVSQFVRAGRFGAFEIGRAKTGQAAIGTLSRRSAELMRAYLNQLGLQPLPKAPLFRTREGAPYRKNSLAEDFRDLRRIVDPQETRQMLDIRRSVAIEARAGGASREHLGAKLANSIAANAELERTYQPVDLNAVQAVDRARLVARRRARQNRSGAKS